jgi:hypothetical protein
MPLTMIHALLQAKGVEEWALCSAVCHTKRRFLGILVQTKQQHTSLSNDTRAPLLNSKLNGVVVLKG